MKDFLALILTFLIVIAPVVYAGSSDPQDIVDAGSPVDCTPSGTFVDVGSVIDTRGVEELGAYFEVVSGDAFQYEVRALGLLTTSGVNEYPIPLENSEVISDDLTVDSGNEAYGRAVNADTTDKALFTWDLKGVVPYTQVQCAGYHGASVIDNVTISDVNLILKR